MSGCPFGFRSAPDLPSASKAADTQKGEGLSPRKSKEPGKCPFSVSAHEAGMRPL